MKNRRSLAAIAVALLFPLCSLAADTAPAEPAAKEAAKPKKADPCVTAATRIKRGSDCTPSAAPTRSFTREEIQQTGENNMAEALRKLDPRFQ